MSVSAQRLIELLSVRGLMAATAESCTGGLLAGAITAVPGSSHCFGLGVVTYSNEAKMRLLQVDQQLLEEHGAVSEQCARAMISGLLTLSGADVALATTGVAGPGGGSEEKPVGLVYIAVGSRSRIQIARCRFSGERAVIREQSVAQALMMAEKLLEEINV